VKRHTPTRLNRELENAINRMDFFRMFKSLSLAYDRESFFLSEMPIYNGGFSLESKHSLINIPVSWSATAPFKLLDNEDPIIVHSKRSTSPFSINVAQSPSSIIEVCGCKFADVIPLHSATANRYCLVMLGNTELTEYKQIATLSLDATVIFQRYFEIVLSKEADGTLNEREIQVTKWTAEGKTSGEIATILGLSEHTINTYIATIFRKLDVVNRAQMVSAALRRGLIH
jgi:DNA-binding CsgD family transcriptional regulator